MATDRAPTAPWVAALTPEKLAALLSRLEGRAARALTLRVLEGRSREDCAAFFGISVPAFDVMLLRAADALEQAVWDAQPHPLLRSDEEQRAAGQLVEALERPDEPAHEPSLPSWLVVRARLLRHLRAHAAEVRAAVEAAERAAETSSSARRELWIRRGLVALLIAAALYLYRRQQLAPPEPRRPRAPAPLVRPAAPERPPRLPRPALAGSRKDRP